MPDDPRAAAIDASWEEFVSLRGMADACRHEAREAHAAGFAAAEAEFIRWLKAIDADEAHYGRTIRVGAGILAELREEAQERALEGAADADA